MGADIHGVLQERYLGSSWTTIATIEDDRNYALFAALADVRNYGGITPISEPRGLPEDFEIDGEEHRMSYTGDKVWMGEHSYSWLSINELLKWHGWDQEDLRVPAETFLAWLKWAELKTSWSDKVEARIVFGFDS